VTRRAYHWTVAAFAIMALGAIVIAAILFHEVHRLDHQEGDLRATNHQLGALVVETAGAVCVLALAPTKQAERRLVREYVNGTPISISMFGPECEAATRIAKQRVFAGR
jgi:hypothetical protein